MYARVSRKVTPSTIHNSNGSSEVYRACHVTSHAFQLALAGRKNQHFDGSYIIYFYHFMYLRYYKIQKVLPSACSNYYDKKHNISL